MCSDELGLGWTTVRSLGTQAEASETISDGLIGDTGIMTTHGLSGSQSCRPESLTKVRQANMPILARGRHSRPAASGTVGGGSNLLQTIP